MSGAYWVPPPGEPPAVPIPAELQPCDADGMCPRLVRKGVRYCCGACGDGWEATPRYEAEHSPSCDARDLERRPGALR